MTGIPLSDRTHTVQGGVLRFITAGSVDDGKSTLIGRLLHDCQAILDDQFASVEKASRHLGRTDVDLSLFTDGLEAEREQGITIDVAYRYFSTGRRKFIIADTPGHEQYTRNMVTGASTAQAAVVLVDARHGLQQQSRRHIYLAALLGLTEIIVAVNKMDLVHFDSSVFERIRSEVLAFAHRLPGARISFVPVSALHGDMVVQRGGRLDWWKGPTLLEILEGIDVMRRLSNLPGRFPVQLVRSPTADMPSRRYLGRVEGGVFRRGDPVVVLPSGRNTVIREIFSLDGSVNEAVAGDAATFVLADELDVSRGDLIAECANVPRPARKVSAWMCWLSEEPFAPQRRYLMRHTTRTVPARQDGVRARVNIRTLEEESFEGMPQLNDIVHATLTLQKPIACDSYRTNRATGAFVLIDEVTNQTVAAGMID